MRTKGAFVIVAALLAAGVALAVVAVRGPSGPRSLQDRSRAVASTLRCPVCQDLSVADSPSGLAREMRAAIAQDLQAGMTPDQIRARFVAAYGQWILLSPTRSGVDVVAWVAPALLFIAGLALGAVAIKRWSSSGSLETPQPSLELSTADRRLLERALGTVEDEDR